MIPYHLRRIEDAWKTAREMRDHALRKQSPSLPAWEEKVRAAKLAYEAAWAAWMAEKAAEMRARREADQAARQQWEEQQRMGRRTRRPDPFWDSIMEEMRQERAASNPHLAVLGLRPGYTPEELRAAYRQKVRAAKLTADTTGDERELRAVLAAYEALRG